jgi:thioredoxin reductase/SAM-dependent methyltransferase
VVDAGDPRNAAAGHVHNYLAREGTPPAELVAAGRAEVTGYGGEVIDGLVSSVERLAEGGERRFRVLLADGGTVLARRLLVATGLTDELPDVPGLARRWGRDVLHCPYCHGWEVRDQAIAVLATGPMAVHQALLFRQLSQTVTLLLHTAAAPAEQEREQLAARGVVIVEGEAAGLEITDDDRLAGVRLRSGELIGCQALVVGPRFTARAGVLASLGLEPTEQKIGDYVLGDAVAADPTGATAVDGVWVAGNVADPRAQVITAAGAGLNAGAAINADLAAADALAAVAAYRDRRARPDHNPPSTRAEAAQYWEDRYREGERRWSGNPNPVLVEAAERLEPGTALDLGCGDGSDAIWLAGRGWRVTAADISAAALTQAAKRAATAGVGATIDWQRHDLARTFPAGSFDLISAQFLHSYGPFPREAVLRTAAAAVAPGGALLVVGHLEFPAWADHHDPHPPLPAPADVLAALDLPAGQWRTERAEVVERQLTSPEGEPGTTTDCIVMVTRIA